MVRSFGLGVEWGCGDPAKEAEFSFKLRLVDGTISCRFLFAATFSRQWSLSFLRYAAEIHLLCG